VSASATLLNAKLPSNLRHDHPRMRAFSYRQLLPVTQSYAALTRHRSVCYRRGVIGDGISTLGIRTCATASNHLSVARMLDGCNDDLFCSCDLDRWSDDLRYTNLASTPWRYTRCADMNLLRQAHSSLSKVIVWQRDRQNY